MTSCTMYQYNTNINLTMRFQQVLHMMRNRFGLPFGHILEIDDGEKASLPLYNN